MDANNCCPPKDNSFRYVIKSKDDGQQHCGLSKTMNMKYVIKYRDVRWDTKCRGKHIELDG